MAWIKCNSIEYIPPVPTGITYSMGVYDGATQKPGGSIHHVGDDIPKDYSRSVIINTKKVKSMTVHVKITQMAFASGSSGDWWKSHTENNSNYTFRVANTTSLNNYSVNISSTDEGEVKKEYEWNYTYNDSQLPDGECELYGKVHINFSQNGDQLDPSASSYLYFTITNVTYK